MNLTLLFWIYLINAVLLINHEIDSAYWQEWKLIKKNDENGINGFLIIHFPLLFILILGLVWIEKDLLAGLVNSLVWGATGIFAFFFHFYHLRKGRSEFNTLISKTILISSFLVSIFQIILTLMLLINS